MNDVEPKAHAEYSASSAERWLNCPGSIALCRKAPPQPESKYAEEGTKAHACFEFLLKNRLQLVGAETMAKSNYGEEMVRHALNAVDWINEEVTNDPGEVLSEEKVDTSAFICDGQFGTLDACIIRDFGRLTIIDYKYGMGIAVDPQNEYGDPNKQLACYALGILTKHHFNFSEVELVVIQPRAWHESGETIRRVVYPIEVMVEQACFFKEGYKRTLAEDASLFSGLHCKFCPAAVICPKLKEESIKEAQIAFSDSEVQSVPEPRLIQLQDLGKVLTACDKIETWIGKVREHAEHVLNSGGTIDGWKLVQKRSTRKWIDIDKTSAEASTYFGQEAFTNPELKSPAQLEKAFKNAPLVKDWVEFKTTNESSGTTMVPAYDKRPAVQPMKDVFLVEGIK